ncbi:MAG: Glycosyl transferase family 2 [Candidatus Gottesmanbacteria bacterium GW2011_GWA1_42_26]|nr:MAG: Glycosyl transferase family 2 [Candidatus Gottesmanbacteria bacterium GW2011_GWA1_42_26]
MIKRANISVIIPIFNEEKTIGDVIKIVGSWPMQPEIVVVDDGSTDGSDLFVKLKQNHGKGWALAQGIKESGGEVLMFLDGDIVGLTHKDLEKLIAPILNNRVDMVLGAVRFLRFKLLGPVPAISGVRVVLRKNVDSHFETMKTTGYGVEMLLNKIHANLRVMTVDLPTVYIVDKLKKQSIGVALTSYIKEWEEVGKQILAGWKT